jgi:hypothetical protein
MFFIMSLFTNSKGNQEELQTENRRFAVQTVTEKGVGD